MQPPQINPLKDEHYQLANKVLASVPAALDLCNRIQGCGIDMTEEIQGLQDQEAKAKAVKYHFFPDRP